MSLLQAIIGAAVLYLIIALLIGYYDWRDELKRRPHNDWTVRLVSAVVTGFFWWLYLISLILLFAKYGLWVLQDFMSSLKENDNYPIAHRLIRLP